MNVTFRLPSEELEKAFIEQALKNGISGVKGHKSGSGCRAFIYNAVSEESVDALLAFMTDFAQKKGETTFPFTQMFSAFTRARLHE